MKCCKQQCQAIDGLENFRDLKNEMIANTTVHGRVQT